MRSLLEDRFIDLFKPGTGSVPEGTGCRSEPGYCDFRTHILENHLDGHTYLQVLIITLYNIAHEADPFFQLNDRDIVRNVRFKLR